MTTISRDDVLALAQLSSLQLQDDEVDSLAVQLPKILEYVEQLSGLDTDGVAPTYQVTGLTNVWRDDVVRPGLSTDELLALAPEVTNQQIKVPKVL